MADLLDAMTGGNFGAEVRQADPTRARLVYASAADLVAALRSLRPKITSSEIVVCILIVIAFIYFVLHPSISDFRQLLGIAQPSSQAISCC
jgi:hypothetical protein